MTRHRRDDLGRLRIAVVGVARDCAGTLGDEVARLRAATAGFRDARFFIVESDSTDDTIGVLDRLSVTVRGFRHVSLGALAPKHRKRPARLAACRNRYLAELRSKAFRDLDYVVVADLDGGNAPLTPEAFLSCWDLREPWDVCMANPQERYYDIWALRHDEWCPDDCHQQARRLEPHVGKRAALEIAVHSRMVRLDPKRPPIEVRSAFGGLAVYRYRALISADYAGRTAAGVSICEHVPLHLALGEAGYRLWINPAMVNNAGQDHVASRQASPLWHDERAGSDLDADAPTLAVLDGDVAEA